MSRRVQQHRRGLWVSGAIQGRGFRRRKVRERDRAGRSDGGEAATKATGEIIDIEKKMSAEFEKRGKTVVRVDRKPFRDATMKLHNGPDATWPRDVYDKLQAL